MTIVVDSNVLVVLTSGDDRQSIAQRKVQRWTDSGADLHAPSLLTYEFANAFTRLIATKAVSDARMKGAWRTMLALSVSYHDLRDDGPHVVTIAQRPRCQSAYDAAYLALAERLNADLWTFDGPLYRNAISLGYPVHLME